MNRCRVRIVSLGEVLLIMIFFYSHENVGGKLILAHGLLMVGRHYLWNPTSTYVPLVLTQNWSLFLLIA